MRRYNKGTLMQTLPQLFADKPGVVGVLSLSTSISEKVETA